MSEYQYYEFMTIDRPLTPQQLEEVEQLSSHIEATATHAFIEYHWGGFKHDPIKVLHKYFDGFLYWANWGSPRLAFRFPHGALPADLIDKYDFDECVTFKKYQQYDILDIEFGEMEPPGMWEHYNLGEMIGIREELMEGDYRALYIAWLASQSRFSGYSDDEDYGEEEDATQYAFPVPPGFATLTSSQKALARLLQLPDELLVAAGKHSTPLQPSTPDDFATWVELLPQSRRSEYLVRLAKNEPGLSRMLIMELRELGRDKPANSAPSGERVSYATLEAESEKIRTRLEEERREQERRERLQRLHYLHDHQETFWRKAEDAVLRKTSSGYDEATQLLVELRDMASEFQETQAFQERFNALIRENLRRPALIRRLQEQHFTIPSA